MKIGCIVAIALTASIATIGVSQAENMSTFRQEGRHHEADVEQRGSWTSHGGVQEGIGHTLRHSSRGVGHAVVQGQFGRAQTIHSRLHGRDLALGVIQDGAAHVARIQLRGKGGGAAIVQSGIGTTVDVDSRGRNNTFRIQTSN